MTRSVVERRKFPPDMVPSASARRREPTGERLRLRPGVSAPGAGQPAAPQPSPGSSGRPRHQKEAAALQVSLAPRRQDAGPLAAPSRGAGRVASAGDRGLDWRPGPRVRTRAPAVALQLPGGPRARRRRAEPGAWPARVGAAPHLGPRCRDPRCTPRLAPCARALPSSPASDRGFPPPQPASPG